jgi:hypothetical protein
MGEGGLIYGNKCGGWVIEVSDPHPAWVTLTWGAAELRCLKVEDLRDLRHIINRAEAAIGAKGAE